MQIPGTSWEKAPSDVERVPPEIFKSIDKQLPEVVYGKMSEAQYKELFDSPEGITYLNIGRAPKHAMALINTPDRLLKIRDANWQNRQTELRLLDKDLFNKPFSKDLGEHVSKGMNDEQYDEFFKQPTSSI